MRAELERGAEHWGAELAFTEQFWEQGLLRSRCLLFWSDWSGLKQTSKLIVPSEAEERKKGGELGEMEDHKRDACAHRGSGCKAEGHHLWPPPLLATFLWPG